MVLTCQKERTEHRRMLQERRRQRAKKEAFKSSATVEVEPSTSSSGCEESSEDDADASLRIRPPKQKAKKATKNIVTSSITGPLDRPKASDRKTVFMLTETSNTWKEC